MKLIDKTTINITMADLYFVKGFAYVPLTVVKQAIKECDVIDPQVFKDQEKEEIFNCIKGCFGDEMGNAIIKAINEVH